MNTPFGDYKAPVTLALVGLFWREELREQHLSPVLPVWRQAFDRLPGDQWDGDHREIIALLQETTIPGPAAPAPSCVTRSPSPAAFAAGGYLEQQTAGSATGPIADYLLGAGLAVGVAGWAGFRAWASHWRWVQAWLAPARLLPGATPPTSA